jgi:hypothetical protein
LKKPVPITFHAVPGDPITAPGRDHRSIHLPLGHVAGRGVLQQQVRFPVAIEVASSDDFPGSSR